MVTKWHRRTVILSVGLGIAFLISAGAVGAISQKPPVRRTAQVAVGLDRKTDASKERLVREIKQQLDERRISATDREVQSAAQQALDLIGKSKDPLKGVIYIKTKKFTFCASWGNDKTFCKAPPQS